jgi:hypothetical protein
VGRSRTRRRRPRRLHPQKSLADPRASSPKTAAPRGSGRPSGKKSSGTRNSKKYSKNLPTSNVLPGDVLLQKTQSTPVVHETEANASWLIYDPAGISGLLVEWQVDHNRYGHYVISLLGLRDGEIAKIQMAKNQKVAEFCGEIAVKGAGKNDLFASYGPDDESVLDQEGTVTNKPRCVMLYPHRRD